MHGVALSAEPDAVYTITILAEIAVAKTERAIRMVTSKTVARTKALTGVYAVKHEIQQTRVAVQVLSLIENMKRIMQKEEDEVDTAKY